MAARSLTSFLAALILFMSFFTSGAGAWYCEGKACGITFGRCCCDDPETTGCKGAHKKPPEKHNSVLCRAGCDCVMVMTADQAATPGEALSLCFSPALLTLVRFEPFVSLIFEERVISFTRSRGPPDKDALFALISPRAPPVT